jgi:hypothetical protein
MRTFAVVPRRKCYWVEATNHDGVRKMIIVQHGANRQAVTL